ncbi:MAG: quinolinate synthase NadA [Phycisphaerales bacterium]|nr:quinolinate synthase NadA [Phycisphaerales bacterium]
MLWQPSLPKGYTAMSPSALHEAIEQRRAELGERLVILGHHYQTDVVIRHADFTGDSLKLSQIAARIAGERNVEYVVFCGVHFMAETADMLTPEHVRVILPDLSAGCSMADMARIDDTIEAWTSIHAALEAKGWRGRIIPITYINSSAAIKAFVGERGGACCTSSNARAIVEWALGGGDTSARDDEDIKILFLPDQHLGRNTSAALGIDVAESSCVYDPRLTRKGEALGGATPEQLLRSRVILWAGHCSVHKLFRPEHCDEIRADSAASPDKPAWKILVHPECGKEVVDKADLSGSTEFIVRTIRGAQAGSRWAVGTETNLVNRIRAEAATRGVEVRILSSCQCLCTTMFRIDEPHLLWTLDHLAGDYARRIPGRKSDGVPSVVNEIRVPPQVQTPALKALDRMLRITNTPAEALARP